MATPLQLAFSELDRLVLIDATYLVLAFVILLVARLALSLFSPFEVDDELTSKDNPAFGISLLGYYLGVLIVYLGAIYEHEPALDSHFADNVLHDAGWALGAVVLLNVSRVLLDALVLRSFSTRKEIVEDKNAGVGAVEFGTYLASALVLAGALSGQGGTWSTALAFWALGQLALIGYALVYQWLTSYDLHAELEADNVAAGVAYGGNLIAMGIVIMRGCSGDFVSWSENLQRLGAYMVVALVLLTIGRFVIDRAFLPARTLHEEIVEDRNLNAGFLEGGLLLGFAAIVAIAT